MDNSNLSQPYFYSNYNFSLKDTLSKAFQSIDGVKLKFNLSFIIYLSAYLAASTLLSLVFNSKPYYNVGDTYNGFLSDMAQGLLILPFLVPMMTGIVMMAIKRAAKEEITILSIFNYYIFVWPLVFATIFITFIQILGYVLLIIPGIFFSITFVFTLPLIVDKKIGIFEAMKLSLTVVSKRWFKFFGLYLILIILGIMSIFTFGIAFIWVIPFSFMVNGILYKEIFDYSSVAEV